MSVLTVASLSNVGAQLTGVDWAEQISDETAKSLYAAWLEHGVLVFPKAGANNEVHVRLSRVFGELEIHPLKALQADDYKELAPFGLQEGEELRNSGVMCNGEHLCGFLYAHQDTAYTPNLCKGSMLRMIVTPEEGGDTRFWDTAKAWRDLPQAMQARLETLSTVQMMRVIPPPRLWGMGQATAVPVDFELDRQQMDKYPQEYPLVLHPMVVTHPESGLKALLLSPQGYVKIEGMDQAESDTLFDEVARHVLQPQYEYRHQWSVDDMVLWDNRRMMHMAVGWPYGQKRFAYRTTLKGGMATGRPYTMPDGTSLMSVFV
jgi:taurine dioxygenase